MSNCIITTAGKAMIAAAQAGGTAFAVDTMILGFREGVDGETVPGADFAFAQGEIKHSTGAISSGLIAADAAVWSAVFNPETGPFTFNIVALASQNTVVAVAFQPQQNKTATSGFSVGNTVIKNFALQIQNVSDLTGISVSAETWQQDLSGVYAAKNHTHDERYSLLAHLHDERYSPIAHSHDNRYAGINAMPPGTVVAMAGNSVPAGFLEANGAQVSRTVYAALFAAIGTLYGSGDGSTTFHLPDFRGKFLRGFKSGLSAPVGTAQGEGLPGVTGTFDGLPAGQGEASSASGAFTQTGVYAGFSTNGDRNNRAHFAFSAHDSNPVYGASEHVTPENYAVLYCVRY